MHTSLTSIEREAFALLCISVDSPRSLGAFLRLQGGEEKQLLDLNWLPSDYNCCESFRRDYLISSFLSKWKGLTTGIDTRSAAIDAWYSAEFVCMVMNDIFRESSLLGVPEKERHVVHYLSDVKRKIAKILGPCEIGRAMELCRWTQGATQDLRRGSHLDKKLSQRMSVTQGALNFILAHLSLDPAWFESLTGDYPLGPFSALPRCFEVVRGSRTLTVAKNAKTDRVIAAEPTANVFLQQGAGRFIRQRLALHSIRIDDQSINQRLAARAVNENLATLDLSAASDTVSRNLVRELLPFDWFQFLDCLRSYETELDGSWVKLQKFSSMGNSFTFELETLIFYAIVKVAQEHACPNRPDVVSVFGDDIIIPSECAKLAVVMLQECGFKVNTEKSFFTGRFYESCGRHYFDGEDVTPTYQRELADSLQEHIRLHNRLVRWALSNNDHSALDAAEYVYQSVRLRGNKKPNIPLNDPSDDGFLVPPQEEYLGKYDANHGFHCLTYVYRPWSYRPTAELPFFAYKLRSPQYFSSADPKGHCEIGTTEGRWCWARALRHNYRDD